MARRCLIFYVSLWSISVTICRVWSFDCRPTGCGCKDASRGIVLDLTAIDKKLTVQNQTVAGSSGKDSVLYFLHLCTPLNLPGNCSNSLVCARDILANTYTSFGQKGTTSYSVFTQAPQIVMTIRDGARRSTVVNLISGRSDTVKLVSANTTTLEFSVVVEDSLTLPADLKLAIDAFETKTTTTVVEDSLTLPADLKLDIHAFEAPNTPNTSSVVPSSPPPSTLSSSSSGPLTILSGASTPTQTHSTTPVFSIPSNPSTPSPPHTSPFPNSTSFTPHSSPLPSSPSTSFTPPSSPSLSVTFTLFPSHSISSSSHSSPSPSLFTSPSHSSPSTSSQLHPHPSPSSKPCVCMDCSRNYALSLGIAVPVTAIVTFLLTIIMVLCCQRVVKRKRQYIRLAPTVYFDEEEHD